MYSEVFSMTLLGLEAVVVKVETDAGVGLPCFEMSGYLATQVREAKERVRVAVRNSGIELKPQRIVVNISPADIRKAGTGFDLPIAIGILAANKQIDDKLLKETVLLGELSLDGSINGVNGVLSSVIAARDNGFKRVIIPTANLAESSIVANYDKGDSIEILGADNLEQVMDYFNGKDTLERAFVKEGGHSEEYDMDFADIIGQEVVKRATLVAAAGMHNIMYIGEPGSGKTMLAKRIPTIMPDLDRSESIELTRIYSAAGKLTEGSVLTKRPFRAPHHSITQTAMLGGGKVPCPGEITLASKGVLFLDEFTEFSSAIMEALRQPLEDRRICVCRLGNEYTYPADFMLVAAINPCKCGFYPDRNRCHCNEQEIGRYLGRISGPIWDRFDMNVRIEKVNIEEIMNRRRQIPDKIIDSAAMKAMVIRAREAQSRRFEGTGISYNSQMQAGHIERFCRLGKREKELINNAYNRLGMTVRSYHKIIKTARTIADIEGEEDIGVRHLSEAISYKSYGDR